MTGSSKRNLGKELAAMLVLLLVILSLLLHGIFLPNHTLFSNDGPLGRLVSQCHEMPGRFAGCWADVNGIGFNTGAAIPGISMGLEYLLKPVLFSKFYALLAQIILGLGAWCFFFQLRLGRAACWLGGLAAALNSCFFSVSCWGVAAQSITAGMTFLALAALTDISSRLRWWRVALAGMAVGMGVIEGSDVGAIFSLYVAAFIIYQAWLAGGTRAEKITRALSRLAVVVVGAAFLALQTVVSLVGTSIQGVEGNRQDLQVKAEQWDWATQWSLPVRETAGLVVPGLFGYRIDTPKGGAYWGEIGRDPAVARFLDDGRQGAQPPGFLRYSGGGYYAGVLVLLVALWAGCQSLRGRNSGGNAAHHRWIWFWLVVAGMSLMLAYGRFAPFYHFIYALPYFSSIRNPIKFVYLVSFALIVIFAYGIEDLWCGYVQPATPPVVPRKGKGSGSPKPAGGFETLWIYGCVVALGGSLLAWAQYGSNHQALADYLATVGFDSPDTDDMASFSIRQVGWFVLFFVLSAGLVAAILRGTFTGTRAKWTSLALGGLLLADLGRANLPWIVFWNYPEKYASNPVIDRLRIQPCQHRVTVLPGAASSSLPYLNQLYRLVWLPQQFPYYNIQTLDVVDMPRMPQDLAAYVNALSAIPNVRGYQALIRLWQFTATDDVLGPASALERLNQDSTGGTFRIAERFDIVPKPGKTGYDHLEDLTTVPDDQGPYALLEFTGALPRARLFSNWQVMPNDDAVLERLGNLAFDPRQSLLVSEQLPAGAGIGGTNVMAGTVEYASYAPKDIVLKCHAPAPAVLLLNDRYDPNWKVFVDGKPDRLLRCNYIMRGVWLPMGDHTVEFRFQPSHELIWVTLSGMAAALFILGVVLVAGRGKSASR